MRILFIDYVFPGQIGPLAAKFADDEENEVFFISRYSRRDFSLPRVKQIILPPMRVKKKNEKSDLLFEADSALRTARHAFKSFYLLRQHGFTPDIVVLNGAWEYWLDGPKVFPDAFVVSYLETFTDHKSEEVFKADFFHTLLQSRQILSSHLCISRTLGEESPYAKIVRTAVALPYPVDTTFFSPHSGGSSCAEYGSPLLFVSTDTEYVDLLFEMLDTILVSLPRRRIILLISDPTVRARAREKLYDSGLINEQRLSLPDALPLREYRNLLRIAGAVVFFDPHPRPDFLLEAMSCSAVVLCSVTGKPKIFRHGWNMIQLDHKNLATQLDSLLLDHSLLSSLRSQARHTVLENFSLGKVIAQHKQQLVNAYIEWSKDRKNLS